MEAMIGRGWLYLDRRLLKDPEILEEEKRLDNEQIDNQHNPSLQTNHAIPTIIRTNNLTIVSEPNPHT